MAMLWSRPVASIIPVHMYTHEVRQFGVASLAGIILAVNSVSAVCASVLAEEAARAAADRLAKAAERADGGTGNRDEQEREPLVILPPLMALDREVRPLAPMGGVGPEGALVGSGTPRQVWRFAPSRSPSTAITR